MLILSAVVLSSCGTQTEIVVSRAARYPEEVEGFLRVLTDEEIRVGVVGTDAVSEKNMAGYVLLHADDAAQFVRNTEELIELRKTR